MASVDTIIKGNQRQTDVLHFPKNIGKYGMLFMFTDYNFDNTRTKINADFVNANIGDYKGSVVLPLPRDGLNENANFKVNETELGLIGGGVASGISDLGSFINSGDFTNNRFSSVKDYTSAAGGVALTLGALPAILAAMSNNKAAAVAGVAGVLGADNVLKGISVGTGQAANSYDALVFDGVTLRNHSFSWSLYPESKEDTNVITAIKKKFQAAAHPTYTSTNGGTSFVSRILFDYPQMVLPFLLIGNDAEHYFHFKPCLIKSIRVSYKGDVGMSFFKDGAPASVEMTLELAETGIWTGEDYDYGRTGSGIDRGAAIAESQAAVAAGNSRNQRGF